MKTTEQKTKRFMLKVGEELMFEIYNVHLVKGTFLRQEGDIVYIKTTEDPLGGIGTEQGINRKFLIKKHE
jgi:hypothetical protein